MSHRQHLAGRRLSYPEALAMLGHRDTLDLRETLDPLPWHLSADEARERNAARLLMRYRQRHNSNPI